MQKRKKSWGRFNSEAELAEFVWNDWRKTKRSQADIARAARTSSYKVGRILNGPPPPEPAAAPPAPRHEPDEVWVSEDGRRIPVSELEPEHARNIVRMVLRARRLRRTSRALLGKALFELVKGAEAREAEMIARLHDDIYNDVMADRMWGSD